MRNLAPGLILAAVLAGCSSKDSPTGPPLGLDYGISDAAHGGLPGFYFLPPMTVEPVVSGEFDADIATLNPSIAICDVTTSFDVDCGGSSAGATPAVIVFTTTSTPAITLDPTAPQYGVNWNTQGPAFVAGHVYRVHVTAGAAATRRALGYADVFLTGSSGQVKVAGDLVVLNAGRTLPIHFSIETGIPGGLSLAAAQPTITTAATDVLTATLTDLHGAPLAGASVAWSVVTTPVAGVADPTQPLNPVSGQTGADGATPTTFKAGTTPGTAVVTAASVGLSATASLTVRSAVKPLYVVNHFANSVTVYAPGANGDAVPTATLMGPNTGLGSPAGIAVDATGKVYVANGDGTILIFAAGASGNVAPAAVLGGLTTGLSSPTGLAVDAAGRLYVANFGTNIVTIYAPGASGDVAPTATIGGPTNTGLNEPEGIVLDAAGNVYVSNAGSNAVMVYAAGASGDVAPTVTIAGEHTGLGFPLGIALDAAGQLYVANGVGGSITVYSHGASGDATPAATISGASTGINFPWGIAVDGTGQLFVANFSGSTITVYAPAANGDAAPAATITGGDTGLSGPFWITF